MRYQFDLTVPRSRDWSQQAFQEARSVIGSDFLVIDDEDVVITPTGPSAFGGGGPMLIRVQGTVRSVSQEEYERLAAEQRR